MLDSTTTQQVLAGVLSILSLGAFWKFAEVFFKDFFKRRQKAKLEDGLRRIAKIYKKMEAMSNKGAHRVILFAGHNNGGIPRLTCGFWVSSIFSHVVEAHRNKSREYNNIPVDSSYVSMLIGTQLRSYMRFVVDEMEPCQLKNYYISEGIKDSIVVFIGIYEQKFMYISMANYERKFTPNEVTDLVLRAQNIKTLFDDYK